MDPLFGFFLVVLGVGLIRLLQRRRDRARRQASHEAYVDRERAKEKEIFLDEVEGYFPFIREPLRRELSGGGELEEALLRAIDSVPSVRLGTTFYELPALLPLSERKKHLYVVGKTGSGKTTLLLNLIQEDLEEERGVGVMAPDAELYRDWLLPMIPENRIDEVLYFAPGNPQCPLVFNPLSLEEGEDQARAAEELVTIFKRAIGIDDLGPRSGPMLANAFLALTGRKGATLWDVKRILEDKSFRKEVTDELTDPYLRDYWQTTFPSYPKDAHLPLVNRLDQFLRPQALRRCLSRPRSSFSIREVLSESKILLIDLSGLAPESMLLLGQMLLSKFQLELFRREAVTQEERPPFFLYTDEFQSFAGVSEGTWRELLSRGRKYGVGLTLANQYPSQLPMALQNEIFGNVASLVSFALGSKDAQAIRKELLEPDDENGGVIPLSLDALVTLRTGRAFARLGSGAWSVPVRAAPPLEKPSRRHGRELQECSWKCSGLPPEADVRPEMAAPVTAEEKSASDQPEVDDYEDPDNLWHE